LPIMIHLRSLLATAACAFTLPAFTQLLVYKTYDDLVNKTPKTYERAEFKKSKGDENAVLIFDRDSKDEIELECADIWGFKYKEATFRITKDSPYFVKKNGVQLGVPMVITHLSDLVLYESGLSFLEAMKSRTGQALLKGMCAAMSKDLNSDFVVAPCYPAKWTDEQILKFLHQYPELSDLATDLEALKASDSRLSAGTFTDGHIKTYVRDYEENKKKKEQ